MLVISAIWKLRKDNYRFTASIAVRNSICRGPNALFWSLGTRKTNGIQTNMQDKHKITL